MRENRISSRTKLMRVVARISADGITWEDISSRDISDGGIGFTAKEPFTKGNIYKINGEITDFMKTMELDCDVLILNVEEDTEGYMHHCKFLNMSHSSHTELGVFIELLVSKFPNLAEDVAG